MANRWRLPSSSPMTSTDGRWMISIRTSLLRVELDDQLLTHGHVDVLAHGQVAHGDLMALGTGLEPRGDLAVERVHVVTDDDQVARLGLQRDDIPAPKAVAGDRDPLAVHH